MRDGTIFVFLITLPFRGGGRVRTDVKSRAKELYSHYTTPPIKKKGTLSSTLLDFQRAKSFVASLKIVSTIFEKFLFSTLARSSTLSTMDCCRVIVLVFVLFSFDGDFDISHWL